MRIYFHVNYAQKSVRISHRSQSMYIVKTSWLMLCKAKSAVDCGDHKKHIVMLCGQKAQVFY